MTNISDSKHHNDIDHDNGSRKRVKYSDKNRPEIDEETIQKAWSHYQSYLDSAEEAAESGNAADVDELHEVVAVLEQVEQIGNDVDTTENLASFCAELVPLHLSTVRDMLPILLSQVYLQLGDDAISREFNGEDEEGEDEDADTPENLFSKSLKFFPRNASALSMLANYRKTNLTAEPNEICEMFEIAGKHAREIRDIAASLLADENEDEDDKEGDKFKEWVELLLLDGISGAEFMEEEDEEDGSEKEESVGENICSIEHQERYEKEMNEREEAKADEISTSGVESTSCFMAAFLHSILKRHDKALKHLAKFDISHRIHPNVWLAADNLCLDKYTAKDKSCELRDGAYFEPRAFQGSESSPLLPTRLYDRLCETFSPNAAFWRESDYQNRGYYSFFEDVTEERKKHPRHLLDDVILNHLLPRAQLSVPSSKIVGYEFWAHTRALKANLGHQLHFDTDEAMLASEQEVTHPIVSSVLYLTGNDNKNKTTAGPTIIFNQTPDSKEVAQNAWISKARDKRFMVFPGNCLHGVLPCTGNPGTRDHPKDRLTLMVGFWTRRVPEKMLDRHLYGPCGKIPEPSEEHTWVVGIQEGYGNAKESECNTTNSQTENIQPKAELLPQISPAWEDISKEVGEEKFRKLDIPSSLDHKFFVKSAPFCFTNSLFRNDKA